MMYLIGFGIFMCGVFVGVNVYKVYVTTKAERILKEIQNRAEQLEPKKINVKLVREGDSVFVYNVDTDEFLTQGTSKREIIDNLVKKYPNTSINATADNMDEVGL